MQLQTTAPEASSQSCSQPPLALRVSTTGCGSVQTANGHDWLRVRVWTPQDGEKALHSL